MFELITAAIKGGKVIEWVALVLGLVVVLGAAGGYGFYQGTLTCVTAQAKVTVSAVPQANAAQAEQDASDYERGRQDGIKKGREDQAAADAAGNLKARARAALSPPAKGCPPQFIPKDLMQGLNDPKIIGGDP
jgi:hypothetical protein